MTAPFVLQLGGFVAELQDNVAEFPLDGPIGWVAVLVLLVLIPVGPWLLRWSGRQFKAGYSMLANRAVGAGDAHRETGAVEVEGTAASLGETTTGMYTDEPALAQKYHEDHVEEEEDPDGNVTTSTRTVDRGSDAVPFLVEDETGSVAVDPAGASLSITEERLHYRDGIGTSSRDYHRYEGRIEPGDSVYVFGQLREADDPADAPGEERTYIGNGDEVPEFVVSDSGQLGTVFDYFLYGAMMTAVGLALTVLIPLLLLIVVEEAFGVPSASWLVELL